MKRTLAEFAESCGGTLRGADRAYSGVSSDTRTIKAGDVVTAYVAPLRDGRAGGLLLEVILPNGKHMLPGVPNADRYKRTS